MVKRIDVNTYIDRYTHLPLVDVRSPGEFFKGRIPGAINIPLFSDEERARVGTAYKQESKEKAIDLGYTYVNPKLNDFITKSSAIAPNKKIIIHCWRGGMRSQSFAQHLHDNGFSEVYVLEKGYKAFRNYVRLFFERPFNLHVIGGYTGSGKTELLEKIKALGEATVDLEGIAHHKGSAFGAIGEQDQPSVEQFENQLFDKLRAFSPEQAIWLEDESLSIGKVVIPRPFFNQIRQQNVYFLDIPVQARAAYLAQTYGRYEKEKLKESLEKIAKRLGYDQLKLALDALEKGELEKVAEIALRYYDKAYLKGVNSRKPASVIKIRLNKVDAIKNTRALIETVKQITKMPENKSLECDIKLTQYSHGAGCGCKISPKALTTILKSQFKPAESNQLIVGNDTRDDAAVYDLGDGNGIISTTDFFLPIVDDPFKFGKIAATNAISDIYAMGGKPLMAIAILGWPVEKLSSEIANLVIEGGRAACKDAGIQLAGGHSIDNPEPLFGLAVTGIVPLKKLKRNDTAKAGCRLFLTKPLGVGVLATAQKKGKLKSEHANIGPDSMMLLNNIGEELSTLKGVTAITDVTGFGLLGHLLEVCEGSNVSAKIEYDKIPVFDPVLDYISQGCIPGGSNRNWDSYGHKVDIPDEEMRFVLCDPQTSGGLLIAATDNSAIRVKQLLKEHNLHCEEIGSLDTYKEGKYVSVI